MKRKSILALCLLAGLVFIPQLVLAADDVVRSGDITVSADEKVMGDVVCLQGDVEVYGEVFGDVVALAGKVTVHAGGAVYGDVVALLGTIKLEPQGSIAGNQVSLGGIGQIVRLPSVRDFGKIRVGFSIFNIVVRVALAVLIGAIFPKALARVSGKLELNMGLCAGAGALTWLAVMPLTVITALTIIGIPLSLMLALALWGGFNLGFAALAALAGIRIMPSQTGGIGPLALGATLLSLLMAVPVIGWVFRLFVGLAGVGAVTLTKFGTQDSV